MTLDTHTIELIVTGLFYLILITGAYWKLKLDIDKRPDFDKVEIMIKNHSVDEKRIEEIIDRDSFPKADGKVLKAQLDNIERMIQSINDKLDLIFKPKKEL